MIRKPRAVLREEQQMRSELLHSVTGDSRLTANDERWMLHALTLAERAERDGEVPIGAVLTVNDELLAEGWNQPVGSNDPTGHAEIIALRAAAVRLKNYRLVGATLYVTLEPCPMCAGAIVQARVGRVVYGASDPQSGAAGSAFNLLAASELNHRPEVVGGALADLCSKRLRVFFEARR